MKGGRPVVSPAKEKKPRKLSASTPVQLAISGMVQKIKGSAKKSKSDIKEAKVISLKTKRERRRSSIATGSEWDVTLKPDSPEPPPLPPRDPTLSKSQSFKVNGTSTKSDAKKKRNTFSGEDAVLRSNSAELMEVRPRRKRKMHDDIPRDKKRKGSIGSSQNESSWPLTNPDTQSEKTAPSLPYMFDSRYEAAKLFECIIHPVKPDKFFSELWEKKPLLVKRHMSTYNNGWLSTAEIDRILRENHLKFSVNIDVTTFENGKRETHNPDGRAYASNLWDYYQNGCSVRMLNPQSYSRNVWKLLSSLQEYFNCFVGANVYLTPPGTQGFAPHYDDIEAFILQLEGKKHWRLYNPRSDSEALPKNSSGNFTEEEIGEPILDVVLEAGDLLYFPRGTIHQGNALDDAHSLHITVSACQKNSWSDLLEKVVPGALEVAFEEDIEFRQALPINYLNFMGVANSDKDSPERQAFLRKIEQLMRKLVSYAPVDAAVDQMGTKLMHDALPPVLTEAEKERSIFSNGEKWHQMNNAVVGRVELEPDSQIKLIRGGILRLVTGENVFMYHCMENSRTYHEFEPQSIEIGPEAAAAVEHLIHSYPNFVSVDSLPLPDQQSQMELVTILYDKGLIITKHPLEPLSEDLSDGDL